MGGGCMTENAIHGAPKKGRKWRMALSSHYKWLQTRGRRLHERKRNSWGSEKGLRIDNCTRNQQKIKKGEKLNVITAEDAIDSKWVMGSPTYLTVFLK